MASWSQLERKKYAVLVTQTTGKEQGASRAPEAEAYNIQGQTQGPRLALNTQGGYFELPGGIMCFVFLFLRHSWKGEGKKKSLTHECKD